MSTVDDLNLGEGRYRTLLENKGGPYQAVIDVRFAFAIVTWKDGRFAVVLKPFDGTLPPDGMIDKYVVTASVPMVPGWKPLSMIEKVKEPGATA